MLFNGFWKSSEQNKAGIDKDDLMRKYKGSPAQEKTHESLTFYPKQCCKNWILGRGYVLPWVQSDHIMNIKWATF